MLKIIFLAMLATGLPVAIAMAGSSLVYILVSGNLPGFTVVHRMIGGIDSFPLLAVPFFILAGNLMNNAGITNRIYNFALALVGWLKGGLGHVNVVGSVVFAGMSGTAIADAAGLGTIEIKAMKDHGYSGEFAVGVTAASATLGPIIPPSLPFVIYAMMANVSVGALFLAGLLPGLLMALMMMLTVAYFAHKNKWGGDIRFDGRRMLRALMELAVVAGWPLAVYGLVQAGLNAQAVVFVGLALLFAGDRFFNWQAVLPIMTPVLLIGGMTAGIFTPTEGAIAASAWAAVLGLFWYRTLNWKMFVKISLDSVETTATIMFVVAAASIFGWMLTATGVTTAIAQWVLGFTKEAWVFLLLANLLMLFVGCFLEPTAAITILVPLLLPIATQLGVDPVHFGLVMVLNLMIGLLHPPMGMVLFVLARVAKLSVERTTVAILPWLVPLLLSLVLLTYVPAIGLWLPRTLGL
jgi:TRAP-type C4-dicarboxylate transport system permease large subunit